MRRYGPAAAVAAGTVAILAAAISARPGRADDFVGYGPIPVTNLQPIRVIFLHLPFDRARARPVGEWELHLDSAESNEIATHQGEIEAVLKFEQNRTVLGGSLGVLPGLEVGLDVPILSRFGGFLDPPIDAVEDLFGAYNVERRMYPNNSFGGFLVQRRGKTLFHGRRQHLELGDVWASAKYELWERPSWPLISVRAALKLPTGRSSGVFGSGQPDLGFGIAAEQRLLRWLVAYGNLNVVWPFGPITPDDLTLNPIVTAAFAAEADLGCRLSFVLQQETYTSPMHGTGARLIDGTTVEMTAGLNWSYEPFLLQFGLVENIGPVSAAADLSLLLRLQWRGLPRAAVAAGIDPPLATATETGPP